MTGLNRVGAIADQVDGLRKYWVSNLPILQVFCGELTAEWREQNPDLISAKNYAEILLGRVRVFVKKLRQKELTR